MRSLEKSGSSASDGPQRGPGAAPWYHRRISLSILGGRGGAALAALLLAGFGGPGPAAAAPPIELPTIRVRLAVSGPARPGPFLPSTRMTLEFVWRGRGRPPGRSRLPPTFETPWERELRRLEDPDLYPELEPLPPESP